MNLETLKTWRFILPGVIAISYGALLGYLTQLWTISLPKISDAIFATIYVVPAALYYITPARSWLNRPHHRKITEYISSEMKRIGGYPASGTTWKQLRPLFFKLVDEDKSLTQKSKLAYSNGLIWTTFADSTVLAIFASISAFVAALAFQINGGYPVAGLFVLIAFFSICGSVVTTRNQIAIAEEQLEIIEMEYSDAVKQRIESLR